MNQKSFYAQTLDNIIKVESFNADSVKINDNQTVYFNRSIGLSNECFNSLIQEADFTMDDWRNLNLIDSLIIKGDSVLYISDFHIPEIDTFTFLPQSEVGDSWTTTGNNITITCIEKRKEFILGMEDSVKIFSVSPSPYDTIQFKLSKKYGLIEFLPFKEFIYNNQNNDFEPYLRLIGYEKEGQSNGYTQPKFQNYFHLHQSDKLFWEIYSNPDDITEPETTIFEVDSVTYSYLSSDSVYYQYQVKKYDEYGNLLYTGNQSSAYTANKQGKILQTPTSWFNVMPPNYYGNDVYFTESLCLSIENNDTISNFGYSVWGVMLDTINCTAWSTADYDRTVRFSTREGLVYTGTFSWGESSKTLIGSIINGNIHGNTNISTGIKLGKDKTILIYPNPVSQNIKIRTNEKIKKITILDITGKKIFETINTEIDLTRQKGGIYFLKIETENKVLTKKIIIE